MRFGIIPVLRDATAVRTRKASDHAPDHAPVGKVDFEEGLI
jgi:hypothetical protein